LKERIIEVAAIKKNNVTGLEKTKIKPIYNLLVCKEGYITVMQISDK
jgi:hypothetical protein